MVSILLRYNKQFLRYWIKTLSHFWTLGRPHRKTRGRIKKLMAPLESSSKTTSRNNFSALTFFLPPSLLLGNFACGQHARHLPVRTAVLAKADSKQRSVTPALKLQWHTEVLKEVEMTSSLPSYINVTKLVPGDQKLQ